MEIDTLKALIKSSADERSRFAERFALSRRYYLNENDITARNNGQSKLNADGGNKALLRNADNRVSSNFHEPIVNQKAAYVATLAPDIDTEDEKINEALRTVLGERFARILFDLVVDASNAGVAWLHVWRDDNTGRLLYGVVPPDQVTPVYTDDLQRNLKGVLRTYRQLDESEGKYYIVHEYWNDKEVQMFRSQRWGDGYRNFETFNSLAVIDIASGESTGDLSNTYEHGLGAVPFIAFRNNKDETPDLTKNKGLIDAFDKIYNGFINDLDDVQQVVLVLKNYGGERLDEFMKALKEDKAIKFETNGAGDQSGLEQLTIDIPYEARKIALDITERAIFQRAQAVNLSDDSGGTSLSGVALRKMYAPLELKSSVVEAQFREGIEKLVRVLLYGLGLDINGVLPINQTWHRSSIQDDVEKAQIISMLQGITSDENMAKANPLVNDWKEEIKLREEDGVAGDSYNNPQARQAIDNNGQGGQEEVK